MADQHGRRSGRTTQQMKDAPPGAVFVWGNSLLAYPVDLARFLGRPDLVIIAPSGIGALHAKRPRPVVVDHGARLSPDLQNHVTQLNCRPAR